MLDTSHQPIKKVPGLDLNNTEVAFAHLSNAQLIRAYWLFKIIGQKLVVRLAPQMTNFSLRMKLPVEGIIKKTIFAHFCGGENIKACIPRIEELARYKVGTILDYAKEGGGREADFDAVKAEIKRTIDEATRHRSIPFAVFKPSAIATLDLLAKIDAGAALTKAEEAAWQRVQARFQEICQHAFDKKVRIMIDAEESWIQNTVDSLAAAMMKAYNRDEAIVFNTVQLYRSDRLSYLKEASQAAAAEGYWLGVKLVRGAYLEKENRVAAEQGRPSPLNPSKSATDRMYDDALRFCIDHIERISLVAGTHNEQSVQLLTQLMAEKGLKASDRRLSFAQLLGMSDHISFNLAALGYQVAKYVPYGPVADLLPYLTRRAQENSSVAGQSSRELTLLKREMQRRGLSKTLPTLQD